MTTTDEHPSPFSTAIVRAAVTLLSLVLVGLLAIQYQVLEQSDHIARVENSTERVEFTVEELRAFVRRIEDEAGSETSRAQDEAIQEAVAEVPKIKSILCEAFPDATACQDG